MSRQTEIIKEQLDELLAVVRTDEDPSSVDEAIRSIPGAWGLSSLTSQRHGYGWHAVLECHASGPTPAHGAGKTMADAIRNAGNVVRERANG